jgi:hypothetical protein
MTMSCQGTDGRRSSPQVKAVSSTHGVAIKRIAPAQVADQVFCVGVYQQLVRVEAVALFGLVGSVHAIAVGKARAGFGQVAVPDAVGALANRNALDLVAALLVEKAQVDALCVLGEERKVDALPVPVGAARIRAARPRP